MSIDWPPLWTDKHAAQIGAFVSKPILRGWTEYTLGISQIPTVKFLPYKPIAIPRQQNGLVITAAADLREFWAGLDETHEPGLADAIGCYIFSIKVGKGIRPWYVGLASKQPFRKECFTAHKLKHYANALAGKNGTPYLTLIAKCTPGYSFSQPSKNRQADIEALEAMLIANALSRNPYLLNIRDTKLLREMVVPGLLNTPPGKPSYATSAFKSLLGLG